MQSFAAEVKSPASRRERMPSEGIPLWCWCGVARGTCSSWRTVVHIVIMGCGRVGSTLAHILEDRGNTVSGIDRDPEAVRRRRSPVKGDRVTGVGFDRAVLTQAGIERADAFVAVSSGDNSNIISARVARETFSVGRG